MEFGWTKHSTFARYHPFGPPGTLNHPFQCIRNRPHIPPHLLPGIYLYFIDILHIARQNCTWIHCGTQHVLCCCWHAMEPPPGVAPPSDRDATSAQSSTIINHPHQQQPLLLGQNVVSSSFAMIPSPSTTAAAHASTSSLSVSPAGPTSIPLAAAASMSSVSGATSTSGSSSGSGQQPPIERLSRPMSFDKVSASLWKTYMYTKIN